MVQHWLSTPCAPLLEYLKQQGAEFSQELLDGMLNLAGVEYDLRGLGEDQSPLSWLHANGAQFPAVLQYHYANGPIDTWSNAAVAWARRKGCTSPHGHPAISTSNQEAASTEDVGSYTAAQLDDMAEA